jgi:riboflavin synthase alpha subunit
LGRKQVGDPVNLEIDLLARYLRRLVETGAAQPQGMGLFERRPL